MVVAAAVTSTLSLLETLPLLDSLPAPGAVPQNPNSDEVCQNRIQYLLQGARPEFRSLQITSNHGTVTLEGRVGSFYLRQLAIQCCHQAAGVFRINDQLQVGTV
jgi:osmotically-inducible protein OsmY